jgi:hypothetical protein
VSPSPRPTSGWAIAAFVSGLISCVPLGLIFGLIALGKTKEGGRRGRGLAIAGLVLSVLWVGGLYAAYDAYEAGDSAPGGGRLGTGDCVDEVSPNIARESMRAVGCDKPHRGEVFTTSPMSSFDDHVSAAQKEKQCREALSAYAPAARNDPTVGIFIQEPSTEDWKEGDHRWLCIATSNPARTGSITAEK